MSIEISPHVRALCAGLLALLTAALLALAPAQGSLVMQHGDEIVGVIDDLGRVFRPVSQTPDDAGRILLQNSDGVTGYLDDLDTFIPRATSGGQTQLIDELVSGGTRITLGDVVDIRRLADGRTVWLETGSDSAGLQHIYVRHEAHFADKGITREEIPTAIMNALEQGNIVGTNGSANVYRVIYNGIEQNIAIGVGSNGFVVRANPVSSWRPLQ